MSVVRKCWRLALDRGRLCCWYLLASCLKCFFFQAEDGIRDLTVTGVQTCALPISSTFKDKIVFLGATAKGIGDIRSTPYQKQDESYMGVETHANVLDNLLHSSEAGDRKSTRLNSSHSQISYAVFCLKKKKHRTPAS